MLSYTDLETAKAARGTRMVANSLVPSPWSEAAKACLLLAKIPAMIVRRAMDTAAIDAWTGIDNVPALIHDREPARSNWCAIVTFCDRHSAGLRLLPDEIGARATTIGVLHEIAGEGGIGWNARLAMIDAGITSNGATGFPIQVAKFLAKRYGYAPDAIAVARAKIAAQLVFLDEQLRGDYFGGDAPNAIDAYCATFLTPVAAPVTEAECPAMFPILRAAFATAHAAFGSLVPPRLLEHRERMFTTHLKRPIEL